MRKVMDPNQGSLLDDSPPSTQPEVIALCDMGGFNVTNADKDEDE